MLQSENLPLPFSPSPVHLCKRTWSVGRKKRGPDPWRTTPRLLEAVLVQGRTLKSVAPRYGLSAQGLSRRFRHVQNADTRVQRKSRGRSPGMMRKLFECVLVAVALLPGAAFAADTPVAEVSQLRMYSSFWQNLHHFLYVSAWATRPAAPGTRRSRFTSASSRRGISCSTAP